MQVVRIAVLGVFGVGLWVSLFSAGLLIDSEPYRRAFARTDAATVAASPAASDVARAQAAGASSLPPVSAEPPQTRPTTSDKIYPRDLLTFAKATLFFTPLNAALLALIAAFVGGCASWLAHRDDKVPASATPDEKALLERRLEFLRENPLTAMLRGFAVYLAVIAGVYITGGDPFEDASASQYVRFAGSISLLAYLVGYDPTRLQDLLDGLPRMGKKA